MGRQVFDCLRYRSPIRAITEAKSIDATPSMAIDCDCARGAGLRSRLLRFPQLLYLHRSSFPHRLQIYLSVIHRYGIFRPNFDIKISVLAHRVRGTLLITRLAMSKSGDFHQPFVIFIFHQTRIRPCRFHGDGGRHDRHRGEGQRRGQSGPL